MRCGASRALGHAALPPPQYCINAHRTIQSVSVRGLIPDPSRHARARYVPQAAPKQSKSLVNWGGLQHCCNVRPSDGRTVPPYCILDVVHYTMVIDLGRARSQTFSGMDQARFISLEDLRTSTVDLAPGHAAMPNTR